MSTKTPSRVRRSTRSTVSPCVLLPRERASASSRPTIARTRSSAVSPASSRDMTSRPSRSTVTRWHSAKTSSSRCEMNSTAAPARAQRLRRRERAAPPRPPRARRSARPSRSPARRARAPWRSRRSAARRSTARARSGRGSSGTPSRRRSLPPRAFIAPRSMRPPAAQRLAPDEDVLGDRQVGEQHRLLVDDRDARVARVPPGRRARSAAVDEQRPAVGQMDARRGSSPASTCRPRSRRRARAPRPDTGRSRRPRARGSRRTSSTRARARGWGS